MTIKFVVHGNSVNAYLHSGSGKVPSPANMNLTGIPTVGADASAIGGQAIGYNGVTLIKGHIFPAFNNSQKTGQISILSRIAPLYSGIPGANSSMISVSGPRFLNGNTVQTVQLDHFTDGNLYLTVTDDLANGIELSNIGAWSPVSGTYYDIVVTYDGTSANNAVKVYIDGTLFAQATTGRVWTSANAIQTAICIGIGIDQILTSNYKLNEYVIWDTVVDPTSGGLNLNGHTRSAFVSTGAQVLDPTASIDPGIGNVLQGISYEINGAALTGTLVLVSNALTSATLIAANPNLPAPNAALQITQGDTAVFNLVATLGPTASLFDLTAATFVTSITNADGTVATIPNGQHTANPDQVGAKGQFTLSLTSAQTLLLKTDKKKEIITQVTQGVNVAYFHGPQLLTVVQNIPSP